MRLGTALIGSVMAAVALQAAPIELKVLEWEGYISPFAEDFTAYAKGKGKDITLKIVEPYITNPDQIFNAARRGEADVVTPTHNYFKMSKGKLMKTLIAIDTSRLSNYPNITESLRNATYDENKGKKYSVPLLGGSYGLAYNVDKIKETPASWEVLWDSANKGKFSLTNDQFEANLYITMLALGYPAESCYDIDKAEFDAAKVQDKLNALVANSGPFWGGMPYADDMKELNYVTDYWFGVADANSKGQNWKFATPKEGQTVWLDTMSISKDIESETEKLEAAYMLVDFMISPEVQKKLHEMYGSVIVNAKTADIMSDEQKTASFVGDPGFFKEEYFWKPLTDRTRNTYKQMWKKALETTGK